MPYRIVTGIIALAGILAFGAISLAETHDAGVTHASHGTYQVLACSGVGAGSSGC